jgi:hypothetical protein
MRVRRGCGCGGGLAWMVRRRRFPRRYFARTIRRRSWCAAPPQALRTHADFERMQIKTTWFIPGHSIETFPEQMQAVAAAGHEIGVHGYSHENPIAMTRQQEADVLDKSIELITQLAGQEADRLCCAVVGIQQRHQRTVDRTWHSLRPQLDAS